MENKSYNLDSVEPLHGSAYYDYLHKAILSAKKSIYAAIFIVDPRVSQDVNLKVRSVFSALCSVKSKGVDVKIIIGTSDAEDIYLANYVAKKYLEHLGLTAKSYKSDKDSLHSKFVIIDERVSIIGSPNWSDGGFGRHIEDSVSIQSNPISKYLKTRFLKIWKTSK